MGIDLEAAFLPGKLFHDSECDKKGQYGASHGSDVSIGKGPMDRRKFLGLMTSGVAAGSRRLSALTMSPPDGHTAVSGQRRPPNVILMICDDLGYGDLGCYGSKAPTPNLDRMAEAGMRFTRHNAAHPICSASRASLLTGRYGTRMNTTGAFGPNSPAGTSLDEAFVSNLFQEKGYSTKAIGKWHLGDRPAYLPTNRGFDSFYGVPWSVDFWPLPLYRDMNILEQDTDRLTLTPRYNREAVKYLKGRKNSNQPFFLYLAYSYPHDPARASKRFANKTGLGHVGDCIAEIDWSVGEVLNAVEKSDLASNTLILFTSDHGPWYQGNPGPLRGRKASTFEGGFRVPLIAKWPGRITPGGVIDQWSSHLDVLPSLAGLCGLSLPTKPLDGVDITGRFNHPGGSRERKPLLYFSAMGDGGLDVHCIRKGDWKLRVAQGTGGEIYVNDRTTGARSSAWLERPELYNLAEDPAESYDVANLHPELVEELRKNLEEQMPSFPAKVVQAYSSLKQRKGDISTPPGASPRRYKAPNPRWSWEPPDRRWIKNAGGPKGDSPDPVD